MLNRVFKTIFILTLCLGLNIPTNAGSVQVSDGSAFITKSELSYQLNNLSSRMTQLENSLDSKIDTLVSSYLTRNGIWNGAKQTITNTQCQAYSTFSAVTSGGLRSWNVSPSAIVSQAYYVPNTYYRPSGIVKTNRTAFTAVLNKSGLLYCKFDVLPWTNQWLRVIPYNTSSSGSYVQGMTGVYSDWMKITTQDNVLKYRDYCASGLIIGGGQPLPVFYDKIVFFFVDKGDILYFETGASCSFAQISTDGPVASHGRKWIFKEISIY